MKYTASDPGTGKRSSTSFVILQVGPMPLIGSQPGAALPTLAAVAPSTVRKICDPPATSHARALPAKRTLSTSPIASGRWRSRSRSSGARR
jgi:hypothetical protein